MPSCPSATALSGSRVGTQVPGVAVVLSQCAAPAPSFGPSAPPAVTIASAAPRTRAVATRLGFDITLFGSPGDGWRTVARIPGARETTISEHPGLRLPWHSLSATLHALAIGSFLHATGACAWG